MFPTLDGRIGIATGLKVDLLAAYVDGLIILVWGSNWKKQRRPLLGPPR